MINCRSALTEFSLSSPVRVLTPPPLDKDHRELLSTAASWFISPPLFILPYFFDLFRYDSAVIDKASSIALLPNVLNLCRRRFFDIRTSSFLVDGDLSATILDSSWSTGSAINASYSSVTHDRPIPIAFKNRRQPVVSRDRNNFRTKLIGKWIKND